MIDLFKINKSEKASLALNMVINIPKYSLCLMRSFGLKTSHVDSAIPKAKAELNIDILDNVQTYIKDVNITGIDYKIVDEHTLSPSIKFEVKA